MTIYEQKFEGHGGGGKSSGSNDKNSLKSNSTAKVLYLLGEGPIKGIYNGLQGVIADDTHVQNSSGVTAIPGVDLYERRGLPTQPSLEAFDDVATEVNVNVKVEKATPIVRSLTDSDFTSVNVTIMFPALVNNTKKGMKKTSVTFRIEVCYDGGAWTNPFGDLTVSGKNTSPYLQQYRTKLPVNPSGLSHPWSVRVTRVTDDSDDDNLQNDIYFQSMTGIIDVSLQYPDSALMGLVFDAEEFSGSVPKVDAIVEGMYLSVPSNLNTETGEYTGVWNGTFKQAYSNDPAWFYYTIATNKRFGLGKYLNAAGVDKWTLYAISQVCQERVSNGYGGTEPRFAINAYITEAREAYEMMQLIASAFRGMSYWSSGAVTATQDVLSDPVHLVTRSNVINGEFNYQSSSVTARHTIVHVKYKDERDDYKEAIEVVRSNDGIKRYGERVKEVDGFGITSRAMARRLGQWVLYTELNETQVITYQASFDHGLRRPGDIVSVLDPEWSNVDYGGRVVTNTSTTVTLDRAVTLEAGKTYKLHVTLADGSLAERTVTNAAGDASVITLASALSGTVVRGAQWILSSDSVEPKPWRIVSVIERDKNIFEITALEVYTPKYSLIDTDIDLDVPNYRDPTDPQPPTNLSSKEVFYYENGVPKTELLFSWQPEATQVYGQFRVEIDTPEATNEYVIPTYTGTSYSIDNSDAGNYTIRVYSLSTNGRARSAAATLTVTAEGVTLAGDITVTGIAIVGETGHEFFTRDMSLTWKNVTPDTKSSTPLLFQQNRIDVYDNSIPSDPVIVGTYYVGTPRFDYTFKMNKSDNGTPVRNLLFKISAQDTTDRWGAASSFEAYNTPPDAPTIMVHAGAGIVLVDTAFPSLKDVVGQRVHISTDPAFVPGGDNLVYTGSSPLVTWPLDAGTYYTRVGLYDTWSDTPVNYTSAVGFTILPTTIDTEPPAIPTGLVLTSAVLNDGSGLVQLIANWTANTEDDFAGYDIQIREGSGNFVSTMSGENTYFWKMLPGTHVGVRIAAFDGVGNKSDYTDIVEHTLAVDTIAPSSPTLLVAVAGIDAIWLKWEGNIEKDLSYYGVYESDENDILTAVKIAESPSNTFARTGLVVNSTRFYWVTAVDTSGNESDPSPYAVATTGSLPEADDMVIEGIVFKPQETSANQIDWTSGTITYGPKGVTPTSKTIAAGNAVYAGSTVYIYYQKGDTSLSYSTNIVLAFMPERKLLGIYNGGTNYASSEGSVILDGANIIAGTVGAAALVATEAIITGTTQLADAIITDAKIVTLSATKLMAGTAIAGSITVSGQSLSNVASWASNPASRINAASTQIDPGKIVVSGTTTLADWRYGGDTTKIDGGDIAANTITANKIAVGARGVEVLNLTFDTNRVNQVTWTAGTIAYIDATGNWAYQSIAAGSATWTSGVIYIWWNRGQGFLNAGPSPYGTPDDVQMANYSGGTNLNASYGKTIIDGSNIKTGTITAAQADISSLRAGILVADVINSAMISANAVTADKINVTNLAAISANLGAITAGSLNINNAFIVSSAGVVTIRSATTGARLVITNSLIQVYDASNVLRVRLGIW